MSFQPGQEPTATQFNALVDKIMATPVSTGLTGSGTVTINVEVLDTVLGTYVFTAVSGRRYRAILSGAKMSGTAGTLAVFRIRDGGASTPTAASTLVAEASVYIPATGGPGQVSLYVSDTWMPSAGTRTLGVFSVSAAGTAAIAPVGTRELYVEDIGGV